MENTADATFAFFVCTVEPERTGALGVGGRDILADVCADRTPLADDTVLDTGSTLSQQLVLLVTASRPGVVRTDGVDLTYSHGLQRGTQTIGTDLRIKTGP
ncbi:hypothetical protein [Nocardioides sp.]|uniref:hypothetical protein n=1 Tax=Nocardioides sp. TaxID=35761 RepID=UPI00286A1389|nr:hypothetical protein [Nocardioides sp.]